MEAVGLAVGALIFLSVLSFFVERMNAIGVDATLMASYIIFSI